MMKLTQENLRVITGGAFLAAWGFGTMCAFAAAANGGMTMWGGILAAWLVVPCIVAGLLGLRLQRKVTMLKREPLTPEQADEIVAAVNRSRGKPPAGSEPWQTD